MSGNPYSTRIEIRGTFAVVSSSHWLATQVGMSILERGGNAYDTLLWRSRSRCRSWSRINAD
jgi:gamma-glutamyltranspeptidase